MAKNKYIGICIPKDTKIEEGSIFKSPFYWCFENLAQMVINNHCIPIFLQYEGNLVNEYLDIIDGLILSGDRDIHPKFYGEELKTVDEKMGLMADIKMEFQKSILEKILIKKEKNIPILGICAGMQSINVAMGGTLIGDIETEIGNKVQHRNGDRPANQIAHFVDVIDKNSFLYNTVKKEHFGVTTNHHQAIKKLANNFKITAISSEDKIIEAIEFIGDSFCLGVQWHPERYATNEDKLILENFFKTC